MAKKSMMKMGMNQHIYINVGLLFVALLINSIFGGGDAMMGEGIMGMVLTMFSDGFLSTLIYLSPLVAMHLGGKRSSWLYFLPLLYNAMLYSSNVSGNWSFWVAAIVAAYASIKLAEQGDMM
ncbi:MAG: hypothetical protein ACR2NY_00780 [Alphaproteobacteria bacterium]